MKPEELADIVFGNNTPKFNLNKLGVIEDKDYYECPECHGLCLDMRYNGYNFMSVSCKNGCKCHGDVWLDRMRNVPKMVKKFLEDWYEQNEKHNIH